MDRHEQGVEELQRGLACGRRRELEDGVLHLLEGLTLIDGERDPRLLLSGTHNLAVCLAHLGLPRLARQLVERTEPLYENLSDRALEARLLWLRGTLERVSGRLPEAISFLEEARLATVRVGDHGAALEIEREAESLHGELASHAAA